jgi:alpha-tubulin suppressor-like RCC1 family protein
LGRPIAQNSGDGDEVAISEATPSMVQGFTTSDGHVEDNTIVQAVGGVTFCIYLSVAGNVYMNGHYRDDDNAAFRGGPSPIGANERPVQVQLPAKAVAIYSSSSASCCAALLEDGRLFTWGMGLNGQLARSPSMFRPNADGTYDLTRSRYVSEVNGNKAFAKDVVKKYVTPAPVQFHKLSGPALPVKILSVACGALHMVRTPLDTS